ncbi:hypothetical protein BCV69DRAFT_285549 [Microstroma glucosiphilum]|uniref:Rad17-domain-containing protein n=1 Tax=Pseudomicrostroma glucosiphilum TaxID=1684307 RepID=A0A316TWV7_9BASI|nr:hypothetical protein BCV69DRAFT_285549 [Pseudomicrostroma glucosiphilum]PWN17956.1 hypothetical protein BCV69DRAFT_285549 [Pseudomicrostroma glucosiphilum]
MAPARALSSSARAPSSSSKGKTKVSATASSSKRSASSSTSSSAAARGGALQFSASPPSRSGVQSKLSFTPAPPEPAKKKVRIEEPKVDWKGKGREVVHSGGGVENNDLWSVAYAPSSRSDLAVHPRKVKDVEAWLRDAFDGSVSLKKLRRLLVLTGPAGAAKTETIRQLSSASELDFEVVEWKNDTMARSGEMLAEDQEFASVTNRFRDFFSRSTKFRTLSMRGENQAYQPQASSSSTSLSFSGTSASPSKRSRRLILLEDLPNLSHPATLQFFQEMIATQLSAPLDARGDQIPICVILSDVSGTSGGLLEDGSTGDDGMRRETDWMRPRRLLGEELNGNDSWLEIKFNPVASTLLKKALKTTLDRATGAGNKKEGKGKTGRNTFPPDLIGIIAEVSNGDIRSAVDTLQQVYANFQSDPKRFDVLSKTKSKRGEEDARNAARELLSSLGVAGRDSSLDLFHALGKILWNKRAGDPNDDEDTPESDNANTTAIDALPEHLNYLERRRSKVDVMALAGSSVDTSMLQLFSHHNYPAFCSEVEQCEGVMEGFSFTDADMKVRGGDGYSTLPLSDHYSFLISTHSTLLHLPSPVERRGQRPTKPALFEINARSRMHRATVEEMKRAMKWELKTNREVVEELLPMVSKMGSALGKKGTIRGVGVGSGSVGAGVAGKVSADLASLGAFDFSVFQDGGSMRGTVGGSTSWSRRRDDEEDLGALDLDAEMDQSVEGVSVSQMTEVERGEGDSADAGAVAGGLRGELAEDGGGEEEDEEEEEEIEDF